MNAAIGLYEAEFLIPGARTLKDKRRVLRSIRDKCARKMNVAIAEVDFQDRAGRSHMAVVTIAAERSVAEKRLRDVEEIFESHPELNILGRQFQWL
ncbi:MAG: hypothetical protein MAG453_00620 [Calditrichaeota bacterium]|nr:hypothetical protein [Calditrichota bacterium]